MHFFVPSKQPSPFPLPLASPLARFCSDSIEPLSLCGRATLVVRHTMRWTDGRRTEERTYKVEDKTRRKDVKSFLPKKYGVAKREVE